MKITGKTGNIIFGHFANKEGKNVTLNGVDNTEYTVTLTEACATNLDKCNVRENSFISFYENAETSLCERFQFSGKYRISTPVEGGFSMKNIFIGRVIRCIERDKLIAVTVPVSVFKDGKKDVEYININIWKEDGDIAEKALLELQVQEGEQKPFVWFICGPEKSFEKKDGTKGSSFSAKEFGVIKEVSKEA